MYKNQYNSHIKFFLSSKTVIIVLFFFLIFIGRAIIREKSRQQDTLKNISTLETSISQIEERNSKLVEMVKFFRSSDFIEREAREKLNMQKPGEKVVIVPRIGQGVVAGDYADAENIPNYLRWWLYFFD
ncbi:hypothetical protein COV56_01655 [Candidatus Kuenenbacteria bacterium CG11_big_fil_rev_8_21_14_0_20_37_9]|uniref:Septum formation initiator n=2 Tax=Candidatus Kueneniibacteriota TaxID=1752740 RepID=A0A2M6XSL8_9BACT|nr:MAG: hypothetical protein AUJ29_02260 [Candidatus Kuenenbacteria bacterium CG1_02_38_13]PIR05667.1 MAG: hypothetical protein COV56_01655 [Candidatus Kuenenbacteria bacterium CG11_big_fil_rev_8_21_14_0_20_37_9]PIU10638.1 MAG: hypothetical protein COT27_02095 [Candidatus Kuenenbacteria bacterium CG08_land_8_20_14_0_20_37_23]